MTPTRVLLFATTNPHKLEEARAILASQGYRVEDLTSALPEGAPEPAEDGATFAENARIKAVYYAARAGQPCLADDSGLEVDALGGAPGVHSARYAGRGSSRAERDAANNAKLLAALEAVPDEARGARFRCAVCLAAPDGRVLAEATGTFEGRIAREPRGQHGFGYDPLLWLPEEGRSAAELSETEKNARSHRGAALRALAAELSRTPVA
jgi:XTP/dITP diphosphohydrolase